MRADPTHLPRLPTANELEGRHPLYSQRNSVLARSWSNGAVHLFAGLNAAATLGDSNWAGGRWGYGCGWGGCGYKWVAAVSTFQMPKSLNSTRSGSARERLQ